MITITLSVSSFNGSPSTSSLSATFDELGGSIGRADTNQLVLPDPDRTISRVHAQVVYRAGNFVVIDRGSNAISVNHRPLGNGREMQLNEGDQLQIGGYVLAVKFAAADQASSGDDPFADLLGPVTGSPSKQPKVMHAPGAVPDPLDFLNVVPEMSTAKAVRSQSQATARPGIPEDWDPFASDPVPAKPMPQDLARSLGARGAGNLGLDVGAAAPGPLIADLPASGAGGDDSLDNLFGLKPGAVGDPLAKSVLDNPVSNPNMAAGSDPLKSLNSLTPASAASISDASSDLHLPFIAPATRQPGLPAGRPAAAAGGSPEAGLPPSAVLSWDTPGGDGHTVIRPAARASETAAAAAPAASPTPTRGVPVGMIQPSIVGQATSTTTSPGPQAQAAGDAPDVLLAAFREGLGTPTVQLEAMTPDLMRLIGQLLQESARGTVELLVARAALKREVRAESTMIVARENNPLKFSPSADAALHHLLAPPTRGFMPAAAAMRDAYDDLRAHQFGFIAGMRAALEGVLERFDPAVLEARLTERSMLESLLPSSRKARMWGVFVEHFEQISREASDDFHSLFGKAFLKAYEEHIDQLKNREEP